MIIPDDITTVALQDRYFDLKGLSAYSSIGVSTLRGLIKSSGLPHFKLSGKILIKQSEFDRWMQQFHRTNTEQLDEIVEEALKAFG